MKNETTLKGTEMELKTEEGTEIVEKKTYTFRQLKATDVFLMSKIISTIGINEFTKCFDNPEVKQMIAAFTDNGEDGTNNTDIASVVGISVALEIANIILGNLSKCEKEIIQLLSNVSGISVKNIENLNAVVFMEMVIDFIKKEEFKDFIKVASRSFK